MSYGWGWYSPLGLPHVMSPLPQSVDILNLHTASQKTIDMLYPAQDYLEGVFISLTQVKMSWQLLLLRAGKRGESCLCLLVILSIPQNPHAHTNMINFNHYYLCNLPHGPCQLGQYIRITQHAQTCHGSSTLVQLEKFM